MINYIVNKKKNSLFSICVIGTYDDTRDSSYVSSSPIKKDKAR